MMISLIEHKSLKEINFLLKKSIKALKTSSNKECLTPSSKKDKIEQNSSTRERKISPKSRHNCHHPYYTAKFIRKDLTRTIPSH